MTVSVQTSVDEPIVSFILEGMLDESTVQEINTETQRMLETMSRYYALIDIRGLETTFGEITAIFDNAGGTGLFADERITPVFVGKTVPDDPTNQMRIPVFKDHESAMDYLRREIAQKGA
jgi:hypothetical protein